MNPSTLNNYSAMFTRFLAMVIRAATTNITSYSIPLSDHQRNAALHLLSTLHSGPSAISQDAVHKLALSLFATDSYSILTDGFSCPLIRFMVLVNVKHDGQLNQPMGITPGLSMLQYCLRGAIYKEILLSQDNYQGGIME
jgi:hypothetical protein